MNLTELAKELVFQMTGKEVIDDCPLQGDAEFQIAYTYLWRVKSHYASLEEERDRLKSQIAKLEKRDLWLTALEHAGVDNWEGYNIAVDIFDEMNSIDE